MDQAAASAPRPAPEEVGDSALVARIVAGDGAAFELLMRRHNRRLYRIARSMLRNGADAEDALQESYLRAYNSLGEFRGESSLATWLSRLVVNECMSRHRRQARRDNIVPIVSADAQGDEESYTMAAADMEGPDASFARAELRVLIERKLDELPETYRTVFVLRCVEELSVEETAECLGIPPATVRTRQFRARGMLRELLAQDMDTAERDVFSFDGARCDRIVTAVLDRLDALSN